MKLQMYSPKPKENIELLICGAKVLALIRNEE